MTSDTVKGDEAILSATNRKNKQNLLYIHLFDLVLIKSTIKDLIDTIQIKIKLLIYTDIKNH
jgi:hypothetical protein